jgi:hypothetical protein
LSGKALQVASVCWLLAGWERSAEFELAPSDWVDFNLSRFSISRGLDELARAELVSIIHRSGWASTVTILDSSAAKLRRGVDDQKIR